MLLIALMLNGDRSRKVSIVLDAIQVQRRAFVVRENPWKYWILHQVLIRSARD